MKTKDVIMTVVFERFASIECEDDETDEETVESLQERDAELRSEHPIANLPDIEWTGDGESTIYRVYHDELSDGIHTQTTSAAEEELEASIRDAETIIDRVWCSRGSHVPTVKQAVNRIVRAMNAVETAWEQAQQLEDK